MNRKIYFILLNIFLAGFYTDLWHNANNVSRLLPVKTFVEDGTWCIDKYHEQTIDKAIIKGHYYSEKAPLPALIITPFYYVAYHTGLYKCMEEDGFLFLLGAIICGTIPFLLIVLLSFNSLTSFGWNIYKAMLATLLLSYSTFIFIYAGTGFGHIMAALWVLLSYIFLEEKKNYLLAGVFAGLAFLTEYPTGILLALWPVILFLRTKKINEPIKFLTGVLPLIVIQLLFNYKFTGSPFDMLYNHQAIDFYHDPNAVMGFALPIPRAMWQLLFGFYRGLFFYAPVLLVIIYMQIKELAGSSKGIFTSYLFPFFILSWLIFSSYRVWYGGWCFGPRHFIPLTALYIYHYGRKLQFKDLAGKLAIALCAAGIIYIWMAKVTVQNLIPAEIQNPFTELVLPAVMKGDFNSNNLMTLAWNIPPIIPALLWILVFAFAAFFLAIKSGKNKIHP